MPEGSLGGQEKGSLLGRPSSQHTPRACAPSSQHVTAPLPKPRSVPEPAGL